MAARRGRGEIHARDPQGRHADAGEEVTALRLRFDNCCRALSEAISTRESSYRPYSVVASVRPIRWCWKPITCAKATMDRGVARGRGGIHAHDPDRFHHIRCPVPIDYRRAR